MSRAPKSGDRGTGPQRHRRRLAFNPDNRRPAKRHAGPADGAGALRFGPAVRAVLDQRWRRVLAVPGFDQIRRRHRADVADLLVDLGAVDGDVVRCGDAEAHLVALATEDRDGDVVADMQGFAVTAGKYQHMLGPVVDRAYFGGHWRIAGQSGSKAIKSI